MPSISQLLTGYPGQITPLPIYSPEQQKTFGNLLQQGEQAFNPMDLERYSQQQFQQNMIPSLSEQFTSLGSGASPSSPAFQNRLANAGAQQSTALAALRSNQGLKALQLGLTPQNEYMYQPERPGLLESGATAATQALAEQAPGLAGKLGSWLFGGSGQSQQQQQQPSSAAGTLGQMAQTAAPALASRVLSGAPAAAAPIAAQAAVPAASAATTALQAAAPTAAGAALNAAAAPVAAGLGTAATAAAASVLLPTALALGIPAAIGLLGFGAIKAYDTYKYYQNKKKEELLQKSQPHLQPNLPRVVHRKAQGKRRK